MTLRHEEISLERTVTGIFIDTYDPFILDIKCSCGNKMEIDSENTDKENGILRKKVYHVKFTCTCGSKVYIQIHP